MNELPPLTERLRRIAELVPKGSRFADVGTDHAYLPAYLAATGICPVCFAGDIHRGPLQNAEATLKKYGVADKVTAVLSEGLSEFPPDCADVVAIAGMGGDQIGEIVTAAPWLKKPQITLLLQPMTMHEHCRRTLHEASFVCEKECYAKEGKRLYVIMQYRFSPSPLSPLDNVTAYIGTAKTNGEPLAEEYIRRRKQKLIRMTEGMAISSRCEDEIAICRELLKELQ